jgi:hypothetical protein
VRPKKHLANVRRVSQSVLTVSVILHRSHDLYYHAHRMLRRVLVAYSQAVGLVMSLTLPTLSLPRLEMYTHICLLGYSNVHRSKWG